MFSPDVKSPLYLSEQAETIFCKGGFLSTLLAFEHRPEQEAMSKSCADAFETDSPLIFEAGTGVGKSLAYIIPGIIAAKKSGRQLVIATHTIALQEQILLKDLPLARLLFSRENSLKEFAGFKTAFLVGRSNYLCTSRLKRAVAEKSELFENEDSKELERIREWALTTQTGLKDEMSPPPKWEVWTWVNADSSSCTAKNCTDGTCFYQKARRAVAGADVVIVNHSLLFSLIASGAASEIGSRGILFSDDMCVIDEAHLIPDVVADNFGLSLSYAGIMQELRRIYDTRRKRGLITRKELANKFDKEAASDCIIACEEFFASVRQQFLTKRDTVSLSAPQWHENYLDAPLDALAKTLASLATKAKTESDANEFKDCQRKIIAIRNSLQDAIFLSNSEHVYWVEKGGRKGENVFVRSAPIDVSPILRQILFERETSVILTSATLATSGGNLESFINRIGADLAETQVQNSPFDFAKNMKVLLCTNVPEPHKDSKKLDCENLAGLIENLCAGVDGGSLVLFTGYFELNKVAQILYESQALGGRKILVQKELSRTELIQIFQESQNAILLGTDSFWTGVDVPGKALSQVIITRLPFANPSLPLNEARNNKLLNEGGNPFAEISIPEAIIKFRQGVGRLIRNKTDKGIVSLLDSRLATKPYGKSFLAALPPAQLMRFSAENAKDAIQEACAQLKI